MHFMFSYVWEFNEEKGFSSKIQSTALIVTKKNASCKMMVSTCLKKSAPNISIYVIQKLVFYSVLVQCTIMYCIVLSLCTHLRRSENPIWHDEQEHDSNYEKGSIWVKMRIAQHHSNIRFTFRGKKVRFFLQKILL